MMSEEATVALVEDDADLRASIAQSLRLAGYEVLAFDHAEAALRGIGAAFAGPVITDVRMPGMSGIDLLHRLVAQDSDLPVLLITGHGDVDMAVGALKAGAWDFLTKPFDPDVLLAAVARAASHRRVVLENRQLRVQADQASAASPLIGRSPAITRLREMASVLAGADLDVLIEGETGTGKELLARLIHGNARPGGRFVALACAAIPTQLVEGDLFASTGMVAGAQGGTLFLDDVDRASPALQARLAQFAETRLLGTGTGAAPINCRIIASISQGAAGGGGGTTDPGLLYRLAGMRLHVPPLRERSEDVLLLFTHFLGEAAARLRQPVPPIDAATRDALIANEWPGNVRQLASFADQVVLGLAQPATQTVAALPDRVAAFEREAIVDAVLQASGDVSSAIEALGLPRKTFYYKVSRHGIDLPALRRTPRPSWDGK